MIKLIATDMDGTLLNSNGELPEEFFTVFKALKEKGVIFAAASGRQFFTLARNFETIKDDMLFIAENGTHIVYKGKEIAINPLSKEKAHKVIAIAETIPDVEIVVGTKEGAFIHKSSKRLLSQVKNYYLNYQVVDDLRAIDGEILKVSLCDFQGAETNSNHYFNDLREDFEICIAGERWLDIMEKGVSKGLGIKEIQELLGITYEETMVFGDYLNDLEMMKEAYYSYAMKNAHPELKEVARFIAKSNDENGVMDKIKEMVLEN